MIKNFINNLLCNKCGKKNLILKAKIKKKRLQDGSIFCKNCKNHILIRRGVIELEFKIKSEVQSKYDEYWRYIPDKFKREKNIGEIKIFNNIKKIFHKKKILDAGCGDGRSISLLANYNPKILVCADFSDSIYITAKKFSGKYYKIPLVFLRVNLHKRFIDKKFFDTTLSLGVINFNINQKKIIEKLNYVSRSTLILGVPSNKSRLGKFYQSLNIIRTLIGNFGSKYFKDIQINFFKQDNKKTKIFKLF